MAELFVPVGLTLALIRFRLTGDPQEMAITLGVGQAGADQTAEEEAENIADAVTGAGSILGSPAEYYSQWTFVGVTTKKQTATGFEVGEHIVNAVGTASGATLPVNTAMLVKKTTALGGRHNRGRCYMPLVGLDESDIDNNGMIASGELTSQQGRWDEFFDLLVAADVVPCLFHYPYTGTPEPAETNLTGFVVQPQVATQRRRLRR